LPAEFRVLVHQTHDAAGAPAQSEYVLDVADLTMHATSENLLAALRPLAPREMGRSGSYWYRDARGTGWLEVTGVNSVVLGELDDAIRTIEIGETLGQPEVFRQENLGFGNLIVPRTTNPYFLMLVGAAFPLFFIGFLIRAVLIGEELGIFIFLGVMLAIVGPIGIWLIVQGARRRPWWHRAREEARRMGRTLPEQLRIWN
jgi:hypothetical protein